MSLYANDTLLYLHDARSSLRAALAIFDDFGRFSDIRINWGKSVLFPLDSGAQESVINPQLLWAADLKYLGIRVTKDLRQFCSLNLYPVLRQLKEKCTVWSTLPLNLMGAS